MITIIKKINNIFFLLAFAFIFLGAMNFMNRYYVWFFAAIGMFFVGALGKSIKLNKECILLLIFSACIVAFSPDTFLKYTYLVKPFVYPLCYIFGYNVLICFKKAGIKEQDKILKGILYLVAAALSCYVLLNTATNFGISGRAELVDFWTKTRSSATTMAAIAVIPLAWAVAILISKSKLTHKLVAAAVFVLSLYFNLLLSGRTLFVMAVLCVAGGFLFIMLEKKNLISFVKVMAIVLILCLLVVLLYSNNVFGIRDIIENSPFYDRFFGKNKMEFGEDGRMENKLDHIKNMIYYPFGGDELRESLNWRSAHDLYLDTYSYSSVFSFVALILFMFSSLKKVLFLLKNSKISFVTRQIIFSVYLLMHIEFLMEPILRGIPWFFAVYCLADGVLACVVKSLKSGKNTELNGTKEVIL